MTGQLNPPRAMAIEGGREFVVTIPQQSPRTFNASGIKQPWLREVLLAGLSGLLAFGSRVNSYRTVNSYMVGYRNFSRYLSAQATAPVSVSGLRPEHIDGFEEHLRRNYAPESQEPFMQTTRVVLSLREFARRNASALQTDALQRLNRTANGEVGSTQPLDAYSGYVADQLRRSARLGIDAAVTRLRAGNEVRAGGKDPLLFGWDQPNLVWLAANRGPLVHRDVSALSWPAFVRDNPVGTANRQVFLTHEDVLAFWILLSLETGLPIESIKALKADCLTNADSNWVHVSYTKNRRHGKEHNTKRIRNGGPKTPGGLLSLAIGLSAAGRALIDSENLWVAYGGRGNFGVPETNGALNAFVACHDLKDDNGAPLRLRLDRLRKTKKAESYRLLKGDVASVADDHSVDVSASRYGNIPSLRAAHEQAVQDGLQEALDALLPRVLTPDEEQLMGLDLEAAATNLNVSLTTVREVLSGERDVWVSNCSDFFNSPFGSPGRACPVAVWGCLDCPNAIITSDRLPAVIAFQSHLRAQRPLMDEGEWQLMYGRAAHRIDQILPKFPSSTVEAARIIAATDPAVLHLPTKAPGARSRRGR